MAKIVRRSARTGAFKARPVSNQIRTASGSGETRAVVKTFSEAGRVTAFAFNMPQITSFAAPRLGSFRAPSAQLSQLLSNITFQESRPVETASASKDEIDRGKALIERLRTSRSSLQRDVVG